LFYTFVIRQYAAGSQAVGALGQNGRGPKVYAAPGSGDPVWSPNGQYIAFIRDQSALLVGSGLHAGFSGVIPADKA
jgi:WD40-like Beta Propeller Repeat